MNQHTANDIHIDFRAVSQPLAIQACHFHSLDVNAFIWNYSHLLEVLANRAMVGHTDSYLVLSRPVTVCIRSGGNLRYTDQYI